MNTPLHSAGRLPASEALSKLDFDFTPEVIYREIQQPLLYTEAGINFYGGHHSTQLPHQPLNILVLTSLRDVAVEEGIGSYFSDGRQELYRRGTLEALLDSCRNGALQGLVDVAAVVTDDYRTDLKGMAIPLTPESGTHWIAPPEAENAAGKTLTEICTNIPSHFRKLPLSDIEGRAIAKHSFESEVATLAKARGADIILSDHYLARLEYLLQDDELAGYGKVLNIHPGITHIDHPLKCPGNAPDEMALWHAKGYRWNNNNQAWQNSQPSYGRAGASLHFVTEAIDTGAVICDGERSVIKPDDSLAMVQYKIYQDSKIPVLLAGLEHYVTRIYPGLDRKPQEDAVDLSSFVFRANRGAMHW